METFRHFFSLILFVCFFLPSTIFRNQGNDGSTAFHADWIEFYWMFISLNVSRFALIFEKKTRFIEDELVWAISCVSSVLVAWAQLAYCCTIRMNRLCLEHFWSSSPANGAFSRWISINKQSITFDQVWMWWQRAFLNSNRSLGGSICTQVVKGSFIFFWFWTGFCFFFGPWTVLECGGLYALKLMFFFLSRIPCFDCE